METNIKTLYEKIHLLSYDYQRLSSSGQETYLEILKELETLKGKTSLKFRELMSSKAFGLTAYYDSMIANWFNAKLKIQFPERKTIFGRRLKKLRYE